MDTTGMLHNKTFPTMHAKFTYVHFSVWSCYMKVTFNMIQSQTKTTLQVLHFVDTCAKFELRIKKSKRYIFTDTATVIQIT